MSEGALSEREAQILQAVVQCYITTAEPVGSRTIVKRFELSLSPATVRNVMADLEEAGCIKRDGRTLRVIDRAALRAEAGSIEDE